MGASEAPARDGAARRQLRGALVERLPLKAVALVSSFALWLVVSADQPGEETLAVRLALRVDSSVAVDGALPFVRATLTGRRRDLLKLHAGDLVVRRTVQATRGDSVRLALRPTDVELPPGMEGGVRVRVVDPGVITLRLTRNAAARGRGRTPFDAPPAAAVSRTEPADAAASDALEDAAVDDDSTSDTLPSPARRAAAPAAPPQVERR